jgi:hypothetical protein
LERAGAAFASRAAVRAQVGAVEGLAGAALLEPLVYGIATDLQKDYTLADSFLNVAFGTILGGGLHVGGGAVRDHISGGGDIRTTPPRPGVGETVARMTPEQRMETFKVALAQAVDGRAVDVEAIVRATDEQFLDGLKADWKAEVDTELSRIRRERLGPGAPEGLPEGSPITRTLAQAVEESDKILEGPLAARVQELQPDLDRIFGRTEKAAPDAPKLSPAEQLKATLAELQANPKKLFEAAKTKPEIFKTLADAVGALDGAAARQIGPPDLRRVSEAVTRTASPEARVALPDAKAATEMTARVQAAEAVERAIQVEPEKAVEAERAELMAEMQDLKAMESALELEPGKFDAEDKLIADAETLAKAADALARCQLRN